MTLSAQMFVNSSSLTAPVAIDWSREIFESLEKYRSSRLRVVLLKISPHANLAFVLGVSEWVCRALATATNCNPTLDYIEGLWAAMVDRRYLAKKQMDYQKFTWQDPPRDAVLFVNNRLFRVYSKCKGNDPDRTADSAQMVALARHVLPAKKDFDKWAEDALKRLAMWFPNETELGAAVPREVLDTTRTYDPERRIDYLNAFLQTLVPDENPFLAKRDALAIPDFKGVPYRTVE